MIKNNFWMVLVLGMFILVPMTKIIFDDTIAKDKESEIFVIVGNEQSRDYKDVKVSFFVPDLNIALASNKFDLNGNSHRSLIFQVMPGDVEPDDYLARVDIRGSKVSKTDYVYLNVR